MTVQPSPAHTLARTSARTPTPRWLGWVVVACFALAASFFLDDAVDDVVQLRSSPGLQLLARWLSLVGEWWMMGLAGILLMFYWRGRGRSQASREVLAVTATGLLTGFTGTLLRSFIGRARPNADFAPGFYGPWHDGHWVVGQYSFGSFPSGHASTLFGLAVAAWLVHRRAGTVLGVFALWVSWSRVAQASHHLSDIVAAAILALALSPRLLELLRMRLGVAAAMAMPPEPTRRHLPEPELVEQV